MPTNINFDKKLGFISRTSIVLPTSTEQPFLDTTSWFGDGVDDQLLSTSDFRSIDNGTQFSWSFWFKLDTIASNQTLIRLNTNTSTQGFHVFFRGGASLQLEAFVEGSSSNWTRSGTGSVKQVNKWYHVCVTLDNTTGNRYTMLKIYLDGVYQGNSNFFAPNMGTGTNLSFLANIDGTLPANANIDEVACWGQGTVLTATQVQEIFNKGLPNDLNNLPTAPQPTNWWRSETATWNGFAWTLTDVNASHPMRSQNMLEANRENDVPYLYSNKSFTFDGVDDFIDTNTTYSELDGQSKASFSAWIKPTATNLLGVILHTPRNTGASDSQCQILIDNGNRLRFQIQDTGTYIYSNTGVFTADTWSHILVCYDGTLASANRGKIFIDGVDQTNAVNMNITSFATSIGSLYIGEHSQGFWNPFSGNIDEVAIWSGVDLRDSASVLTIFNQGVPNNLNENGLTAPTTYYRMGEDATWNGTNWTLNDNGSGGNNGTSQNMVLASRTNDVPLFNTKSILFDGVDDRIDLASRTQNFTDFSLSFWVVWGGGNYKTIVGSSVSGQGGILWGVVQAGGQIRYFDATSGWTNLSGSISDGNWHHILITYDSSATTIKGYKDGTLAVTKTDVDVNNPTNAHSFDQIGARQNTGLYNQKLEEIAVWDSIIDISDVWDGSNTPTNLSSTSPIHWWRMGDYDSYPTLIDRGSGNNNGTMTNMTSASIVDDVPE